MPIQVQGNAGVVADVDGTNYRALRVRAAPIDVAALGHYMISMVSGDIAAGMAANGEIFQVRWTDATRLCIPLFLRVDGMRASTAFAAGSINIGAIIARSWTADGSGGTAATLTGNNQKLRTSMGTSLMGTIRVASTAALGGGTKTLDSQEIARIVTHSSGGVGSATPIIGSIYLPMFNLLEQDMGDGGHPIVLAQNEGLVVRATVPGTGVWSIGFTFKWAEVAAF